MEPEIILTEFWPFEVIQGICFTLQGVEGFLSTPPTGFNGFISNIVHMLEAKRSPAKCV